MPLCFVHLSYHLPCHLSLCHTTCLCHLSLFHVTWHVTILCHVPCHVVVSLCCVTFPYHFATSSHCFVIPLNFAISVPLWHSSLSHHLCHTISATPSLPHHLCHTVFATPHHFAKQLEVSFGMAGVFPLRATVPDLMPQRNNPSREIFGHNKSAINSLFLQFFVQEPGNVFTMLYFLHN
jgi:hypothetical protein